jgi:hypothetical protein
MLKPMNKKIVVLFLMVFIWAKDVQIINGYEYSPPKGLTFLTSFPSDIKEYGKLTFRKEKINEWLLVSALTGIMIVYDEPLIVEAQKTGNKFNLTNEDNTTEFFSIFDQPIRFPTDLGSSLYFIGDGILHLGIASSFYTYGKFIDDNRAMQTGSQIAQAMASAGFLTQMIKHITGRVSPFKNYTSQDTLKDGAIIYHPEDKWTPFPNQIEYHEHVSTYDAFPSGHMAVCMATVTVIAENYSEIKWVRPIGYTAMTLLGFQMMNNGVHWVSDHPLSIAMGYYLGKIAAENGRKKISGEHKSNLSIKPMINTNLTGITINYSF